MDTDKPRNLNDVKEEIRSQLEEKMKKANREIQNLEKQDNSFLSTLVFRMKIYLFVIAVIVKNWAMVWIFFNYVLPYLQPSQDVLNTFVESSQYDVVNVRKIFGSKVDSIPGSYVLFYVCFLTIFELSSSFSEAKKLNLKLARDNWKLNNKIMEFAKKLSQDRKTEDTLNKD